MRVSAGLIFALGTFYSRTSYAQDFDQGNRRLRGYMNQQHLVNLPIVFENIADVGSLQRGTDTPIYWHILKSGGTTMKHVFGQCLNLVVADEKNHGEENNLHIVWEEGNQYVNVDTSTPHGIERAGAMHLAQSGMVDVVITPHVHEMANIFDPGHKGKLFALIRHPIDRAVSMFYYLQTATWEPSYDPSLQHMTLEQYAHSDKVEENWMTRFLVNKKSEPLGPQDVVLAREILRTKFAVGLLSRINDSMDRFAQVFGWDISQPERRVCIQSLLTNGVNRHEHPEIERGGEIWNAFLENNRYDVELYMYTVQLFQEQGTGLGLQDIMNF